MSEVLPEKMTELPVDTREFLARLRPDELETLQAIVDLPAADVREGFKMVRDMRTVGRFFRWLIIGCIAFFLSAVVLYENILKAIGYFRGHP